MYIYTYIYKCIYMYIHIYVYVGGALWALWGPEGPCGFPLGPCGGAYDHTYSYSMWGLVGLMGAHRWAPGGPHSRGSGGPGGPPEKQKCGGYQR